MCWKQRFEVRMRLTGFRSMASAGSVSCRGRNALAAQPKALLGAVAFLSLATCCHASSPVLFFSDLVDGPRTGGDTSWSSRGAYVCVWGKNFGPSRGTSTITVGGTEVGAYVTWDDPTPTLPDMRIAKACFQLGSAVTPSATIGDRSIQITVNGQASNALPFTVRADSGTDSIYFVDGDHGNDANSGHWGAPWQTVNKVCSSAPASAIVYARHSATSYAPGSMQTPGCTSLGGSSAGGYGTLSGYPGEVATIGTQATTTNIYLTSSTGYVMFANLVLRNAGSDVLDCRTTHCRVVGNDVSVRGTGISAAMSFIGGVGYAALLGNHIHHGSYYEAAYLITGLTNGGKTITYSTELDPLGGHQPLCPGHDWTQCGSATAFLETTGGTSLSCTSPGTVCVGGHLQAGPPYNVGVYAHILDDGAGHFSLCNISDLAAVGWNDLKVTPITFTDIGTGTSILRPTPNTNSHMVYISYGFDHVEFAWNEMDNNWQGKDMQAYTDTPGDMQTAPTNGNYMLDQPILSGNASKNPDAPVITFVSGGSLPLRTYYINWTYQTPYGETPPSHPLQVTVPANKLISMSSPPHQGNNKIYNKHVWLYDYSFTYANPSAHLYGEGCLISIVVSGGNPDTTINLNATAPDGSRCNPASEYVGNSPVGLPWITGDKIGILGEPALNGLYTISSVDATHVYLNTGKTAGTYTTSTLRVSKFRDYAYNVYVSVTPSIMGGDDWDGLLQTPRPIANLISWTEPSSCPTTCFSNTYIRNDLTKPPSRLGEVPGTTAQTGMDIGPYGMSHLQFHDNVIHDSPRNWFNLSEPDPFYGDVKLYNNLLYHMGLISQGACISIGGASNGPRAVGALEFYNNTCYDTGSGQPTDPSTSMFGGSEWVVWPSTGGYGLKSPMMTVRYRNNIFWARSDVKYYASGGLDSSIIGSNNIFYGDAGDEFAVTDYTALTTNIFLDPGLRNPSGFDFHLASSTSQAYGQGVLVPAGTDFDGLPRPQGGRYDIGAYQFAGQASVISCDVNGDGVVNVLDVQIATNQALGMLPCTTADLQQNGNCSVTDVQRVIVASLGGACKVGP